MAIVSYAMTLTAINQIADLKLDDRLDEAFRQFKNCVRRSRYRLKFGLLQGHKRSVSSIPRSRAQRNWPLRHVVFAGPRHGLRGRR